MACYTGFMKRFYEIIGWYGAIALLVGYALISFSVIKADGLWYQLISVSGCAGIAGVSLSKKTYQPAALNLIMLFIGLVALARIFLR